jgi:dienelactone hydrolase
MAKASSRSREVVLIHSVLGLRPGVLQSAARLREVGHIVHTPDLYGGEVFDDMATALRRSEEIGMRNFIARSEEAVSHLPAELVYMGFSLGGDCAQFLAGNRPGAQGAVLLHSALPVRELGLKAWPSTVPVQVHFAEADPWREQQFIDQLATDVRNVGTVFEQYDYAGSGHLFTDPDSPDYDAAATEVLWGRVLAFLDGRPHPQ